MNWSGGAVETLPHIQRRQIMYARSTTIQAQPTSIDAGITHMRDKVMPALEGIPGCLGLSLLVDRTSGRCIATSSWDSEEAMRASEETIRPIRDQAAELFGGGTQIEEWEIAAMHREHRAGEGACVRATWVKVDPDQIDRGIDFYKATILPALEELEGFCSASLLVDRASGRGVAAATFDNAEAIERNKDQLDRIRATGSQEANAEVLDQCDFELAVAHLRVPEMV
jgi:heme-degrading monooxygenase HmoA